METKSWPIEKVARFHGQLWTNIPHDLSCQMNLLIKGGHLLVVCGTDVLESCSLTQGSNNLSGFHKGKTLGIVQRVGNQTKKFRVLFGTSQESHLCAEYLRKIITFSSLKETESANKSLTEQLLDSLTADNQNIPVPESIPEDFPLGPAVQLCLLDPGFPRLVSRVYQVIETLKDDAHL